jgi:glycosyltransferase involved in cell wall biosynthesis
MGKRDGIRARIGEAVTRLLHTENRILHSPEVLRSRWPQRLNNSNADVINLHWIGYEMISVADIARFQKPVVWTLHDMWAFCGAEHFTEDFRWREGYLRNNRPVHESGFDLDRWTWKRKSNHWRRPIQIVAPSHWLADCARQSALMREWPVSVIPYAIDTEAWHPVDKQLARKILGLPVDSPLLIFGAIGGTRDPRKGFDLLKGALDHLRGEIQGLELVVLGQTPPMKPTDLGFPVHYAGHLHDDISMSLFYSAADALILPSRQDNLPNVGIEAQACGTPVVAFNACGLPDIVEHKETGYLAKAFDTQDLAEGIRWVLADTGRRARLSSQSRNAAVAKFSYPVVAEQYLRLYETVARPHD